MKRSLADLEAQLAERQQCQRKLRMRKKQLLTQWRASQSAGQPALLIAGGLLASVAIWATLQSIQPKRAIKAWFYQWLDRKAYELVQTVMVSLRERGANRNVGHRVEEGS